MVIRNNRLALAFAAMMCVACSSHQTSTADRAEYIPVAPDYSDSSMWYQQQNDADGQGADIFYVVSTWEFDWTTADGNVCHYADPVNTQSHRDDMTIEISKIAGYMAPGNNFYSPFYRHITLDSWGTCNEDTINRRYHAVAFQDVQRSFQYFLDSLNEQRPFVLAGFSQGGKSVVELMKTMSDEVKERMVAAYVLGYKVTSQDIAVCKNLKAAQDSVDLGVTICYNSVSDVKYVQPIIAKDNVMCINPVNWRTDATPAVLHDTITVTLSPQYQVLVLDGYSGSEYSPILGIINVGDFHSAEPWLYSECLAKNIRQRIEAYHAHRP
ncbi:MAG: DUF3089 domain-containing protein [Bacteroides sp.]|nr:DUF3089 domain-containing protein [Bacteroides sp.]